MKEEKVLCTNALDQVSQPWEALIDDVELEKVTEELHIAETELTQLKNEMKQLPLVKKIAREIEMKKLQQHIKVLCTKQQQCVDKVEEL